MQGFVSITNIVRRLDRIKLGLMAIACGAIAVGAASPASAFITFDHRENLNVLNSPDVSINALYYSAGNNSSGSELRGYAAETSSSGVGWFAFFTDTQKEVFNIDLGAERNIETFRLTGNGPGAPRDIKTATIETSSDGITWSGGLSHSTTYFTHSRTDDETRLVLDTPVNTRYLRLTGDTYDYDTGGSRQVAFTQLAIYGAAGTVLADRGLDLVSSTGWTSANGGNATITTNASTLPIWLTGMADDNEADSTNRQLVYDIAPGQHVDVTFDTVVKNIGRVGFTNHGANNPGMHFEFLGSADGMTFPTLLVDYDPSVSGAIPFGPKFFDLSSTYNLKAVRFQVVSTPGSVPSYVDDLFVFQVPEPASMSLLGLGGLMLLRRRRA